METFSFIRNNDETLNILYENIKSYIISNFENVDLEVNNHITEFYIMETTNFLKFDSILITIQKNFNTLFVTINILKKNFLNINDFKFFLNSFN